MRKSAREQTNEAEAQVEPSAEAAEADSTDRADRGAYRDLGDHVASVLNAAEAAAAVIREQAGQEAAAKVGEATRRAGTILHEAEGLRAESVESDRQLRAQAEAYAERTRREADEEAAKLLEAARETAATTTREQEARQHALREDIARTEKRLAELGLGLRDLAAQLEALVMAKAAREGETEVRRDDGASLDTSLMASLGAERPPE